MRVHHLLATSLVASLGTVVALPLALPAAAGPLVGAAGAAGAAAPPVTVTLVGSLQTELGCADDWSPPCEETRLTAGDGGVWSGTFTVPEGAWELKVALNGSWDESYGANGGSANIPLALTHEADLTVSFDETSHQVAVAPAELPSGEPTAEDRRLAGDSLRSPLTRERFYFVMADRFANGSTANDEGGLAGDRMATGFDPTDKGFFHGGDIAGLTEKLDYLAGLGTTAIWLTPSFQNRPVQGSGATASAGYHGYWVTDFTRLDPHFGTNAELRTLIDRAHRRGIKVFFDIITNHTADVIDYAEAGSHAYVSKEAQPYLDADEQPFDDRDFAGGSTFPELDAQKSFPYTPIFHSAADETVKLPAWLNDPRRYHNRGDSTFAGESSTYGDFAGLDDLFTEQPEVVDGMTDIYQAWVDFGVDGFRIDTVKHVNMEFWQQFAPAMRAEADRVGNHDFFAFGEVFDSNQEFVSSYTTTGRLDATLDFGFQGAGTAFAKGKPTTGLRDYYAGDDWFTDTDSNAYELPTFLGNHDMGRIGHFLAADSSGDELLARDELAHELMFLTRGQPVVYYGDEQGFTGDGGDQDARQDMFPSRVATYNDDDLIGTDATTADANFDTGHPLYRTIASLARLRARYPALADGAQLHRFASSRAGVFAVSRIDADENREYVVALNNATTAKTASFVTATSRGTFRQVWPATSGRLTTDDEARTTVTVPPLSAVVFRATTTVDRRRFAPALQFAAPTAGGVVGGRSEIGVGVPDGGFNQVTFAWRPAGAADWTKLGTDDNAPYRVFHDVSSMPTGTLLEYRAVLRDSSGNLSVTSTYASVGSPAPGGGGGGGGGGPVTQPPAVSMPGSHNSELGCTGDWQPDCDQAQLTLDPQDDVWKRTVALPAGDFEYKAAIDKKWDENYGLGAEPNGKNIPLSLPAARDVTFFYDHATHWITTNAQGPIVTAPGSFQSELGCPGDWAPDCMRSWLQDPDGDGVYTFSTTQLPAGSYEAKAAHGLSWDENYGAGGAPNGANIGFDVPTDGLEVVFSYDLASHVLTITTRAAGANPDLGKAKAQWVTRGLVAWKVTDPASRRYRLHWSAAGDLEVDAETVGGRSVPLTFDPAGLPDAVLARFPQLDGYSAFRLRPRDLGRVPEILRGQVAGASYSLDGSLFDATGVQLPGVLDDVYAGATGRDLGVVWQGREPSLAVWAPTAQDVDLLSCGRGRRPRPSGSP